MRPAPTTRFRAGTPTWVSASVSTDRALRAAALSLTPAALDSSTAFPSGTDLRRVRSRTHPGPSSAIGITAISCGE